VERSSGAYYWLSPSGLVLAGTDTPGNTVNEYVFFGGMRIARRDPSGNVYYYFGNALGSATITNASGSICYDADFYPFGGELTFTNTCSQNYKFTGMERDVETGNDHAWFRNYEQNLGRWMSPDPLGGDITNPQSLNRYAYVMNSPTSLTDPLGLCQPVNGIPCHPVYDPSTCDGIACPSGSSGGGGGWRPHMGE
jgi:RHS repeat-associated protein